MIWPSRRWRGCGMLGRRSPSRSARLLQLQALYLGVSILSSNTRGTSRLLLLPTQWWEVTTLHERLQLAWSWAHIRACQPFLTLGQGSPCGICSCGESDQQVTYHSGVGRKNRPLMSCHCDKRFRNSFILV